MAEAEALVAVAGMTFALMKLGRSTSHINHPHTLEGVRVRARGAIRAEVAMREGQGKQPLVLVSRVVV